MARKAKPLEIPASRPVATGELVDIRQLPEYRRRHGLRIVRAEWPLIHDESANGKVRPAERWPRMIVEDEPTQKENHEDYRD